MASCTSRRHSTTRSSRLPIPKVTWWRGRAPEPSVSAVPARGRRSRRRRPRYAQGMVPRPLGCARWMSA
ncbi:hypothetical protein GBAR_LOCUS4049 [Geodia barretti]|uniref:Uncharacterized protein n=1 Tax=Geodia barretti TaxID=519541 RepID=A0AA35R5E9_GEOBA|nr:hypothetical protein GBAR_LOCUS4049 [Geodia barretti]